MAAKAVASGTSAGAVAPHHRGLIAGGALSLSLIGDAAMAALHLKQKGR